MINARAARRFRLAGKLYAKGDPLSLPTTQFDDLASAGLVTRLPAPSPAVAAEIAIAVDPAPIGDDIKIETHLPPMRSPVKPPAIPKPRPARGRKPAARKAG